MTIENAARLVPMMFRAQIQNRCQLQRIPTDKNSEPDIIPWQKEWTQEVYPKLPATGAGVQEREYQISWRMVSNSGVDDTIIRPVIGARGWPYYPGSGMKGVFRRACNPAQLGRYCGRETGQNDCEPGILRFHGGYPTDASWQDGLVDIVHPQQSNQVGMLEKGGASAFAMISLDRPTLRFGISSSVDLDETEWAEIWQIWDKAIQIGIGGRTSAGYGQINTPAKSPLYKCQLAGRGQAPKLLDGTGEFRPNVFRAALRGHALRIFGGLTDASSAKKLVGDLFGSLDRGCTQGLLSLNFIEDEVSIETFRPRTQWAQPTYQATGEVNWQLTGSLDKEHRLALKQLVTGLTHFAMTLGGFGKSWRRADHRLFLETYSRALIGCHWKWTSDSDLQRDRNWHIGRLDQVQPRMEKLKQAALTWMELQRVQELPPASWREAWHPSRVQVWGRIAEDAEDSRAIHWLHGSYSDSGTIYKSALAGKMGQVGKIWHRMYPAIPLGKNEADPKLPRVIRRKDFIELLTIFPDRNIPECQPFLDFLAEQHRNDEKEFAKLWGD